MHAGQRQTLEFGPHIFPWLYASKILMGSSLVAWWLGLCALTTWPGFSPWLRNWGPPRCTAKHLMKFSRKVWFLACVLPVTFVVVLIMYLVYEAKTNYILIDIFFSNIFILNFTERGFVFCCHPLLQTQSRFFLFSSLMKWQVKLLFS